METQNGIKISEFARLSGIKRKNLIFYDEIDLLKPEYVHSNGYRYYSHNQLVTAAVISSLKEIGMQLSSIKAYLTNRSPENTVSLFMEQNNKIEQQILKLKRIQSMMNSRIQTVKEGIACSVGQISYRYFESESIFSGDAIILQNEDSILDALNIFYDKCESNNIPYWYPLCFCISGEAFSHKNWEQLSYYYYRVPKNQLTTHYAERPEGYYIVSFGFGDYGDIEKLCQNIYNYINENGYEICGDIYGDYLLDEITTDQTDQYLLRLMAKVKYKKASS